MKKTYIKAICLLLLFPFFTHASVQAADTKSGSIGIPVSTGLIGSGNSSKSFYLDLPSGVTSSAIKTETFKYSGNNSVIGAISIENGKVKLTLKGNEKLETFNVKGKDDTYSKDFKTTPGNSIWRYADGRRWQINDYNSDIGSNYSYNVNAADSGTPSANPPIRTVTTKANPVNPNQATWFKNEVDTVPYSSVIQSSIRLNPLTLDGDPGTTNIKDGKFIITYKVPSRRSVPEEVSDSFDKGQWVEGRLYYVTLPYYFTASANVTSYKYSGNVSFDYALPTEPTLTGTVTLNKPNPNPAKLGDKDEPVQFTLKGELLGYTDSSNIQEWVFYAQKKNQPATLIMKKESAKSLTASKAFDFTIQKAEVTGETFTQEYDLRVRIRFKTPITTKNSPIPIDSLEQPLNISAGVYKTISPVTYPTTPPAPTVPDGKPPIARISTSRYVKAGEDLFITGRGSVDPDGTIEGYWWDTPGAQGQMGNESTGTVWYTKEQVGQTFPIALSVMDNDGLTGSTSAEVTVIKPEPAAYLSVEGTLKQNRKVILRNSSTSPARFPLVPQKTYVILSAVSGGTDADIKYSGTLGDFATKDLLFKQPGTYKAAIYVENTLGYSASTSITFDIIPDKAPVNYFSMAGVAYRSPENGNKALVSIDDMSYSPDKDVIGRRLWEYRYDSDNNGNFNNEAWVIFSNANEERLNMLVSEVGKYEVRLTVFEEFGQPTIDEFVTASDRKSTNSDGQAVSERIVEIKNRAPEVDWSW